MAYDAQNWTLPTVPSSTIDDPFSLVTGGLANTGYTDFSGLTSVGLTGFGPATDATVTPPPASIGTILDPNGNTTTLSADSSNLLANMPVVATNGTPVLTIPGPLATAVDPNLARANQYQQEDEGIYSYTGSDLRVVMEVPDPTGSGQSKRRQLLELQTLSISIFRVKTPVTACGYINNKGSARGRRTIAGTIVLTQFTVDVMYRFLYSGLQATDLSKDSVYLKPDQLPPFDLTLYFCDEYGNESSRRLLGVDVGNDGVVYGQQDMFTEQTLSYIAADCTPLMPVHRSALMNPANNTVAAQAVKTPMQVFSALGAAAPSIPKSGNGQLNLANQLQPLLG